MKIFRKRINKNGTQDQQKHRAKFPNLQAEF